MTNGGNELSEYVVSECYGDIFSFDCGTGNKIRINKDFFGVSAKQGSCSYSRGDCITSNPKSNSLIHRLVEWCLCNGVEMENTHLMIRFLSLSLCQRERERDSML